MTIHHIVLVKVKPGTDQARLDRMVEAVAAFKENIPGVLKASAGKNFTDRGKGYEYGGGGSAMQFYLGAIAYSDGLSVWLWLDGAHTCDLAIYIDHELHVNFKAVHMAPIVDEALAFDYEA
ncbi:hypothetical protein BC938DRAFT_472311 [Jimgerdemannia flammicorona]|uniref:Stress-response A/B barrel domain-containing protein n=1 Tax=Jimgerdemannia flammicorona TaxID=994334 RepID=A0A433Q6C7_9FUNG|nr:hypothetical protein BC938DRAFT_472311 [Jimgerdemannia flammicorona]